VVLWRRWKNLRLTILLTLLSGETILDANKAYADFREAIESARESADNLVDWIKSGGFWPDGMTPQDVEFLFSHQKYLRHIGNDLALSGGSQCLGIVGDDK
jgi:hypothetical protein